MPQEERLQGRWLTDEGQYVERIQGGKGSTEPLGVDFEHRPVALDDDVVNAVQSVEASRSTRQLGSDRRSCEVPELCKGAALDRAAVPDNADAVAQALDLSQHVAGQQYRVPLVLELVDAFLEHRFHEWV